MITFKEREHIYYLVDKRTILITGEYDRNGHPCTRVLTGKTSFLVNRSPLQLLDETLTYIGFDLRGAVASAKLILGKKVKCPVMVNPYQGICFFPNKSPNKIDCIWFNPEHIVKTKALGGKTEVELSNGYTIIVESKLSAFNDKIQAANQLKQISMGRGMQTGSVQFILEPKKDRQLSKKKTGKYNFDVLEEEH